MICAGFSIGFFNSRRGDCDAQSAGRFRRNPLSHREVGPCERYTPFPAPSYINERWCERLEIAICKTKAFRGVFPASREAIS
jgi:hypothetical protein